MGPVVATPVRIEASAVSRRADGLEGEGVALDGHFGNLLTNVEGADFATLGWSAGDRVPVRIGSRQLTLPFARTFSEVPVGSALLYIDSRGRVALAVNRGSFEKTYGVTVPTRIVIARKPQPKGEGS